MSPLTISQPAIARSLKPRWIPCQTADRVAFGQQRFGQMPADKARRSNHEDCFHRFICLGEFELDRLTTRNFNSLRVYPLIIFG